MRFPGTTRYFGRRAGCGLILHFRRLAFGFVVCALTELTCLRSRLFVWIPLTRCMGSVHLPQWHGCYGGRAGASLYQLIGIGAKHNGATRPALAIVPRIPE